MSEFDYDPLEEIDRSMGSAYRDELVDARKAMLRSRHGQLFMHYVLAKARLFATGFVPGAGGDRSTAYELGRKSVGLEILSDLTIANPRALEVILRRADRVGDKE